MLQEITKTASAPQVKPPQTVKKTTADWFHECVLRGRKEVFCEIVTLTPDIARFFLAANHSNRLVKTGVLETYKQDILSGRWALNGESIKFAKNGDLIDGQHRCWAVVETDKAIKTLVMFGIENDNRMTLDQGAARSSADYLMMEGEVKYVTIVAGVARTLLILRRGLHSKAGGLEGATRLAIRAEYWSNDKEINSAVVFCCGSRKQNVPSGGAVAASAALVLARRISPSADDFFDRLITGADLSKGSPILAVRNKFSGSKGLRPADKVRLILHAFEAWIDDRPLQIVRPKGTVKSKQKVAK